MAAIRDHQVVIVAGETGSGKTTQLPKIRLELGRGTEAPRHTQPRRIAAWSVAERIAEELEVELGTAIGYQVRFTDQSSDNTVKVMTDGILLNEMQRDRPWASTTRSSSTRLTSGPSTSTSSSAISSSSCRGGLTLKVVITSATIDPERFAEHFAAADGTPAPIVEVSGRMYPVEIRYRPLVDPDREDADERDQVTGSATRSRSCDRDPRRRR